MTKTEALAVLEGRAAAAEALAIQRREIAAPMYEGEIYAQKAQTYRSVIALVTQIEDDGSDTE